MTRLRASDPLQLLDGVRGHVLLSLFSLMLAVLILQLQPLVG